MKEKITVEDPNILRRTVADHERMKYIVTPSETLAHSCIGMANRIREKIKKGWNIRSEGE